MNYLFDACSIYKAIRERKLMLLMNAYTVDLAPYEIGNSILREAKQNRRITYGEAKKLIQLITSIMKVMNVLYVVDYEPEILELAFREGINFYDASYIFGALKTRSVLVTEDEYMRWYAKKLVKVVSLDDLVPKVKTQTC